MTMGVKECALLVTILLVESTLESGAGDVDRLVRLDAVVLPQVEAAWAKVTDPNWVNLGKVGGIDIKLVKLFRKITEALEGLESAVPPGLGDASLELAQLDEEVKALEGFFETFRTFQGRNDVAVWQRDWRNFAEAALQTTPPSVRAALERLHQILAKAPDESFYRRVLQDGDAVMCQGGQSLQQLIFNLYTYLHMVQLKGYVMLQFSWMLLRLYGKGNFVTESMNEKNKFYKRFDKQMEMARQVLETTSNEMRRCDPPKNIEGETYAQITRLLQGYIQNEVDMNGDESCSENCAYYSYAKQHGCFKNGFCARQPSCTGRILNCQFVDADMGVCLSDIGSTRRYNWIQYENGRTLGKRGTCSKYNVVDSWWRWLVLHCSYCFCLCDEPGRHSDRYFSLRPSSSNTTFNKVVTGVRFAKRNRMIHLQIQEGELLPHGGINQNSVSWRPVPDFRIDDPDVKDGVDYHTLSWESRALDLDDVKLPPKCLLTGVRLRKLGDHLNLEAECSLFNVTTGKLVKPATRKIWLGNDNTDGSVAFPREELILKKPDDPMAALPGCPSVRSTSNMFIKFVNSDIDADAAQTTVPFIDIQSVAPSPATPLVGVGIYHRGCQNSGGYVAPKVMTYDASQHLLETVTVGSEA